VVRKGGRRDALAINPQTAARLRAYLELAGHGADLDGPRTGARLLGAPAANRPVR
jgi:hypothetical protein